MMSARKTLLLTALAMLAFAANSLLCRLALQQPTIDPASFGAVRLAAGAVTLGLVVRLRRPPAVAARGDWLAATMLFGYVAFFSFAYLSLSAGTGALILFGAVQLTMFGVGLYGGERFRAAAWAGLALALAGLVVLVAPGLTAPPLLGALSMGLAGIAWGVYSLRGRGVTDPIGATAGNFFRAAPLAVALAVALALMGQARANATGLALAVASGAVTSGLGYVVWYAALAGLSSLRAATVQLSVPVIAAFAGVLFLGEAITPRLALASLAIVGGIALVLTSRAGPRECASADS